ncbi:MAG: hypothetical protein IKQ46_08465 [Bacteroidales bacterium]|nr:hypothetical protein [Bacteroidales bacterium]
MGKNKKQKSLDYLDAVKKADREKEILMHGKLISTRPERIKQSKKVYNRKRDKNIRNFDTETSGCFILY